MNNYTEEWQFICIRIEELESAIKNFLLVESAFIKKPIDEKDEEELNFFSQIISPAFVKIFDDVKQWQEKNKLFLPVEINNIVENYLKPDKFHNSGNAWFDWKRCVEKLGKIENIGSVVSVRLRTACQAALSIVSLKFQINSHLKNSELKIKNLTELGFEHLRRTIAVNDDVKNKWQLSKNEVQCEKMGAIHLLSHGIWAFKAYGEKGRTDLVYNEPLERHMDSINRSAQGLVLTEWKKVTEATLQNEAEKARKQLIKYSNAGVLGGIELKNTRYVILIIDKTQEIIEDWYDSNICYRHIIIETDPYLPSEN